MLPTNQKEKSLTNASPLFLSTWEEGSYLTTSLRLESFQKKLRELISIRWWMDFITCMIRDMHIEISNQKIFYYRTNSYLNSLILVFLVCLKEKMVQAFCIQSLALKAIWHHKFQQKITMELKLIFSQQE